MHFWEKYNGFWRGFRPFYWIYNLWYQKYFSEQKKLLKHYGINKYYWQSISHKDMPKENAFIPWLDVEALDELLLDEDTVFWRKNGYLIYKEYFNSECISSIITSISNLKQNEQIQYNYSGKKIMQIHKKSDAIQAIMYDNTLLKKLKFILGKEVTPYHSIYFDQGSEQAPHSDNIHMSTYPKGFLIAVWVALEDIEEGSGELLYYEGSHKLPYLYNEDYDNNSTGLWIDQNANKKYEKKIDDLIIENHLEAKKLLAKKGDILIWHANLIHGGAKVVNTELSRKSLVFHYFAKDVICYHEISQRLALINA